LGKGEDVFREKCALGDLEQQSVAAKPSSEVEKVDRPLGEQAELGGTTNSLEEVVEKLRLLGRVIVERRGLRSWTGI